MFVENGWLNSDDYDVSNDQLCSNMIKILYKHKILKLDDKTYVRLYRNNCISFDEVKIDLNIPYHIMINTADNTNSKITLVKYKTYENHQIIVIDRGKIDVRVIDNDCFLHFYLYCKIVDDKDKDQLISYLREHEDLLFIIDKVWDSCRLG